MKVITVYFRFLAPEGADKKGKGKKKRNSIGRGGGKRKTEEEEDAELLQADLHGHRGTRLTVLFRLMISS